MRLPSIGRKLSSLRAFFKLMLRRRLVAASPVGALRAPKRTKRLPAFLGAAGPAPSADELADGFTVTGFFLTRHAFEPRGLAGQLYWWSVAPFHAIVFGGMARNIARSAERQARVS